MQRIGCIKLVKETGKKSKYTEDEKLFDNCFKSVIWFVPKELTEAFFERK